MNLTNGETRAASITWRISLPRGLGARARKQALYTSTDTTLLDLYPGSLMGSSPSGSPSGAGLVSAGLRHYSYGSGWQAISHTSFEAPNIYHYVLPQVPAGVELSYYFTKVTITIRDAPVIHQPTWTKVIAIAIAALHSDPLDPCRF